jgi:ubiquinone/menaquinone biosynthesis C-methylase UbiE
LKDYALTSWKDKRKIMQLYNATSESYDEQYAEEQMRKYQKALENVNVTDKAVLDVGCGSGLFFKEIAAQTEIVVGVDVSHKLLLKAKKNANGFQNAFILQADADHLPFKNGFYDTVFAFTILQNLPKPSETLGELKRVANKDGRVVVTGLKKAFPLEKFMDVLEGSGLEVVTFVDEDNINCYVAVLTK